MENLKVPLVSVAKSCVYLVPRLLKQPGCSSVAPDVATATDMARFRRVYCTEVKKKKKIVWKSTSGKEWIGSRLDALMNISATGAFLFGLLSACCGSDLLKSCVP